MAERSERSELFLIVRDLKDELEMREQMRRQELGYVGRAFEAWFDLMGLWQTILLAVFLASCLAVVVLVR